ncbi:MAG: hypothetical protein K2K49_04435 [Duncaniella sp.]|nr:hypothetical protein [Duncaniella sp.]
MKTFLLPSRAVLMLITALLPMILFCSCKDEPGMIWDFYPVTASINIKNIHGENLLLPTANGSLYGKKITVEYDGQEYELDWEAERGSRYYLPHFTGLTLINGGQFSADEEWVPNPYLSFGEFDGEDDQNITFKFWIEGYDTVWTINVVHTVKWKGNKPKVTNKYFRNGKEVKSIVITL